MNKTILERHLRALSCAYRLEVESNFRFFIIRNFQLPPGYNQTTIPVWADIPLDYPESPPGVGAHIYLPQGLKYRGRTPRDYHPKSGPRGWAWWCYKRIDWDPCKDDLLVFFELLRTHMTNPA